MISLDEAFREADKALKTAECKALDGAGLKTPAGRRASGRRWAPSSGHANCNVDPNKARITLFPTLDSSLIVANHGQNGQRDLGAHPPAGAPEIDGRPVTQTFGSCQPRGCNACDDFIDYIVVIAQHTGIPRHTSKSRIARIKSSSLHKPLPNMVIHKKFRLCGLVRRHN